MEEELKIHLNKFATSPFLFVGSGISRRYLGLETWADLLGKITDEIGMANSFRYYLSKANGDLPEVASIIAEEFYDLWWKEERFKESRKEFQDKVRTSQCPFKFEITKYIRNKGLTNIKELEHEINLFRKVNIDGIITTNWDLFLESIFPDFSVFIGQESILFQDYISVGDVYKIHGCSSNPNSLVLTSSDYENFNNKNPYLAAKLLTIFIEQPIIFLGYSLNDHNIQEILKSIIACLSRHNIDKLKDRLIFCEWIPDDVEPTMIDSTLLISDTVLPIKLIRLNNFSPLYTVLANNKKRLPIKILRNMKDMVFDFVKSNQSKSKVFVSDDLDEIENIEKS
ncbi:SIR2 family protein [Tenacibaculum sp. ZH5_bin.1]|uniref:SIR2 family protein n=1 Tax=Tenacibaculum TaxID=104267 RepID=UPI00143117AF|nr:SIR2 family protein [Tenacibaculum mesophilum]KAF9658221.1 SIR2 family protein [Tenacibaculum mesophilum]